jgi:hypothetical protein
MKLQSRKLEENDRHVLILIASMLSSEDQAKPHAVWLWTTDAGYFCTSAGTKIIFVGDPAQLPPVGQLLSPALDKNWLENKGRKVIQHTLARMNALQANNDILVVA